MGGKGSSLWAHAPEGAREWVEPSRAGTGAWARGGCAFRCTSRRARSKGPSPAALALPRAPAVASIGHGDEQDPQGGGYSGRGEGVRRAVSGAGRERETEAARKAAAVVARAREYARQDKPVELGLELESIATELGDRALSQRARLALGRTRRIEREALDGVTPVSEVNAERNRILQLLDSLTDDLEDEVRRQEEARPSPLLAPPRSARVEPGQEVGAMVRCASVEKRYGARFKLGPVSFALKHGEILGVVGPNASGKTSLLRILAGQLAPSAGTCKVAARNAGEQVLATRALMVPESPPLWSGSMEDHLAFQAALFGYRKLLENARQVAHVLKQLDIVAHRKKLYGQLSDGIRMRTAIAAALLARPGLVILDEPLGPLDPRSQQDLLRWMLTWAKRKSPTSFIIAAHHVTDIEAVADQVLSLLPGQACAAVPAGEVEGTPGTHLRVGLLPGADGEAVCARLREMGLRVVPQASYVLVQAPAEVGLDLAGLAQRLAGLGVSSIQDLSRSHLKRLIWGKGS